MLAAVMSGNNIRLRPEMPARTESGAMLGYYVIFGMAAVVLLFVWHRGRQKRDAEQAEYDPHGRGLADEAATAVGDVAREFIGPERH